MAKYAFSVGEHPGLLDLAGAWREVTDDEVTSVLYIIPREDGEITITLIPQTGEGCLTTPRELPSKGGTLPDITTLAYNLMCELDEEFDGGNPYFSRLLYNG